MMPHPSGVICLFLLLAHIQSATSFSFDQHSHLLKFEFEGIVYQRFRQLRTQWPYLAFTKIVYKSRSGNVLDPTILRVHLDLYDPDTHQAIATAAYYAEPGRWTDPTIYHSMPSPYTRWLPEEAPQLSIGAAIQLLQLGGRVGPWGEVMVWKPEDAPQTVTRGFVYDFFREDALALRMDGWTGEIVWPLRDQAPGTIVTGSPRNVTTPRNFSMDG